MSLQILTLQLEGITASDYLSWCRDPDPPAFNLGLRSICLEADPLGQTITAILDWDHPAPKLATAARAAGLPLSADVRICQSESCALGASDSPRARVSGPVSLPPPI